MVLGLGLDMIVWKANASDQGNNNSFLAKSKQNGGVQFSRDPLNLINKNTRKHAGFVNDKVY
jgi:hypothetical protein